MSDERISTALARVWQFRGVPDPELSAVSNPLVRALTLMGALALPPYLYFHFYESPEPMLLLLPMLLVIGAFVGAGALPVSARAGFNLTAITLAMFGGVLIIRYPDSLFFGLVPLLLALFLIDAVYGFPRALLAAFVCISAYAGLYAELNAASPPGDVLFQWYQGCFWSLAFLTAVTMLYNETLNQRLAAAAGSAEPLSENPATRGDQGQPPTGLPASERFRALLVDDDRPSRRQLEQFFKRFPKVDAVTAGSATEALHALAGEGFDLIITDYFMPGMDGAELTRLLRSGGNQTFVIGVTSATIMVEQDQLWLSGADMVMTKPLSPVALEAMLARRFGIGDGPMAADSAA